MKLRWFIRNLVFFIICSGLYFWQVTSSGLGEAPVSELLLSTLGGGFSLLLLGYGAECFLKALLALGLALLKGAFASVFFGGFWAILFVVLFAFVGLYIVCAITVVAGLIRFVMSGWEAIQQDMAKKNEGCIAHIQL